jgi:hypothetical protein
VFENLESLDWQQVVSSSVVRLAYRNTGMGDEVRTAAGGRERVEVSVGEVYIEFKSKEGEENRIYCYSGVPETRFLQVLDSQSIGSAVHKLIKPFSFEEVVALPEPPELDEDPVLALLTEIRDGQREMVTAVKELTQLLGSLRRVPSQSSVTRPVAQGAT